MVYFHSLLSLFGIFLFSQAHDFKILEQSGIKMVCPFLEYQ